MKPEVRCRLLNWNIIVSTRLSDKSFPLQFGRSITKSILLKEIEDTENEKFYLHSSNMYDFLTFRSLGLFILLGSEPMA